MTTLAYASAIHNAQPFSGQGVSLYVTIGASVAYRRRRLGGRRSVLRKGWSGRDAKTLRVASETGTTGDDVELTYSIPASMASESIAIDVRHYLDNVENATTNSGIARVDLDANRDDDTAILGTASSIAPEIRAGGIVRFAWLYHAADDGAQPTSFRIEFASGPTSPDDIETPVVGDHDYEVDSLALDDSAEYTVNLYAETDTLSTLLLTRTVTADASGPPAPTLVSATAH